MEQHDPQTQERANPSQGKLMPSLPPVSRRSAVTGAVAALLVIALGAAIFASLSNQRGALGAAAGCTPTATVAGTATTVDTPMATAGNTPTGGTPSAAGTATVVGTPVADTPTPSADGTPTAAETSTECTPTAEGTPTATVDTPTAVPSPTVGKSTVQAPKHGAGLPEGVEVISFVLTGPDEGWGTGGVITNPVTGMPDRGMVLHYAAGAWTQVGATLSGVYLGGLDMVSSSEGWAMGGDGYGRSYLLHIHNGTWQQVTLPGIDPHAALATMAMRTPGEGWLAMANPKSAYSGANTSLYHYAGGKWAPVAISIKYITDIAPVADGEAWVIGQNTDGTSSLVYVRGGTAAVELTSPGNSSFSRLRMFAPNDIWIEGAMHASTNADIDDVPLTYHFDGEAWTNVNLDVPNGAQHVSIVASDTVWSFANVEEAPPNQTAEGQLAAIYAKSDGSWQALSVPYKDLQSLKVVSTSSTDIWATGVYVVTTRLPDHNGAASYSGISHYVLLHYSGGSWTEYGR